MSDTLRFRTRSIWFQITLLLFATALIGSAAAASETNPLRLDDAVSRALQHDTRIVSADLTFEQARVTYQRAVANNLMQSSAHADYVAETNFRIAELTHDDQRTQVIIDTVQQYFNSYINSIDVKVREDQLQSARLQLESVRARLQTGSANQLELIDAQAQLESARIALDQSKRRYAQGLESLREAIGVAKDTEVGLNVEVAVTRPEYDIEAAIAAAKVRNLNLIRAQLAVDNARIDLDGARLVGAAPLDLRGYELALERARLDLNQAHQTIERQVRDAYHNLHISLDEHQIQETRLLAESERYGIVLQQARSGLRTERETIQAAVSLAQAQSSRMSDLRDYLVAYLAFVRLIGGPDEVAQVVETVGR